MKLLSALIFLLRPTMPEVPICHLLLFRDMYGPGLMIIHWFSHERWDEDFLFTWFYHSCYELNLSPNSWDTSLVNE
jgi:hypothetical protein